MNTIRLRISLTLAILLFHFQTPWARGNFNNLSDWPTGTIELFNEAQTLERRDAFDRAKVVYEKVLLQCPNNVHALLGLGRCFKGLNSTEKANAVFQKVREIEPENEELKLTLGIYRERQERIDKYQRATAEESALNLLIASAQRQRTIQWTDDIKTMDELRQIWREYASNLTSFAAQNIESMTDQENWISRLFSECESKRVFKRRDLLDSSLALRKKLVAFSDEKSLQLLELSLPFPLKHEM